MTGPRILNFFQHTVKFFEGGLYIAHENPETPESKSSLEQCLSYGSINPREKIDCIRKEELVTGKGKDCKFESVKVVYHKHSDLTFITSELNELSTADIAKLIEQVNTCMARLSSSLSIDTFVQKDETLKLLLTNQIQADNSLKDFLLKTLSEKQTEENTRKQAKMTEDQIQNFEVRLKEIENTHIQNCDRYTKNLNQLIKNKMEELEQNFKKNTQNFDELVTDKMRDLEQKINSTPKFSCLPEDEYIKTDSETSSIDKRKDEEIRKLKEKVAELESEIESLRKQLEKEKQKISTNASTEQKYVKLSPPNTSSSSSIQRSSPSKSSRLSTSSQRSSVSPDSLSNNQVKALPPKITPLSSKSPSSKSPASYKRS